MRALNWDELPLTMTPDDIFKMQILPLGRQAIYNLCHKPGFPVTRIGKKIVISRDRLRGWIEARAN